MSYLKFLNLMQADKKMPVLDAMALFSDAAPATVHRRLKSLRAKGFIALQIDEQDNRVKYIVPTPQTRKYFAKIDECLHAART